MVVEFQLSPTGLHSPTGTQDLHTESFFLVAALIPILPNNKNMKKRK